MELKDIEFVFDAHKNKTKQDKSQFRKWDNFTPYYVHPFLCATLILHEPSLSRELREKGSVALLYHDVLEDTDAKLPGWLNSDIKQIIKDMTFYSSKEEREKIWNKSPEIRLLKLFDKVGNILDGVWMTQDRALIHKGYLKKLADDATKTYGSLNIVKIARAII